MPTLQADTDIVMRIAHSTISGTCSPFRATGDWGYFRRRVAGRPSHR